MSTDNTRSSETMRFVFGLIILIMMTGLIVGLFFIKIPEGNDNPLVQLVGTVGTLAGMVIGYCFATSASSNAKNQLLDRAIGQQATGKIDDPIHVEPTETEDK